MENGNGYYMVIVSFSMAHDSYSCQVSDYVKYIVE